jgi:hypothetical protein
VQSAVPDSLFILMREGIFYDAWCQFYQSRKFLDKKGTRILDFHAFKQNDVAFIDGDTVVPVWDNYVASEPLEIQKGQYRIGVVVKGTAVKDIYPQLLLYANELKLGEFYCNDQYMEYKFECNFLEKGWFTIKVKMDNDAMDKSTSEDRNAFIKRIYILKLSD